MDYFCVDVETSGPVPGMHSLLSIGVTHVRRFQGKYQPMEDCYVELQPAFPEAEEAAMRVNGLDLARLESEGMEPGAAVQKIVTFVEAQRSAKRGGKAVFVAHNAPFDWMFFIYYAGHYEVDHPFGFACIDTKALAMGALDLAWTETSLQNVAKLVDAEHPDPSQLHHAGADARHTARVFSALMNRTS